MHKTISISLDEHVLELLDDEIIRNPDCHNRSQVIRSIVQRYLEDRGRLPRGNAPLPSASLEKAEKELALIKQLVGALVFNTISNMGTAEDGSPLSLSALTDLPLIEESLIHDALAEKLSQRNEGKRA